MVVCTICYENNAMNFVALKCGHVFHSDCITKWNDFNNICPFCRESLYITTILYCKYKYVYFCILFFF